MTKKHCDICGSLSVEHKAKDVKRTYKGSSFIINQPADWCSACGEGVIHPKDNLATAVEVQTEKAKIDGLLPPLAIKAIRKKLDLTQKEASEYFGGGANAFNRYENGVNPPSRALSLLLITYESTPSAFKKAVAKSKGSFAYLMPANDEAIPVTDDEAL
tara:strand:- start:3271 stop:3747 length:477 start_codon:yes stop_codon:yes gene_type:complete